MPLSVHRVGLKGAGRYANPDEVRTAGERPEGANRGPQRVPGVETAGAFETLVD